MTEFVAVNPPRFGRRVKVDIFDGTTPVKTIFGFDDAEEPAYGLRISFSIEKKIAIQGDSAKIKIYNLAPDSRAAIAQRSIYAKRQDPLHYVRLEAGYVGNDNNNVGVLFNGTIVTAINKRQGPDWVTEIEGNAVFGQSFLNTLEKSWSKTPVKDIVVELFGVAGWSKVTFAPEASKVLTGKIENTFVTSGSAYASLQLLLEGYRLTFNVDVDGAVVFSPGFPREAPALQIDETTGLLGSPEPTFIGANFKSFLDPRIRPGQLVQIDSETLRESLSDLGSIGRSFMAWEVNHSGDTHSDDWFSEVVAWFSPLQIDVAAGNIAGPQLTDTEGSF